MHVAHLLPLALCLASSALGAQNRQITLGSAKDNTLYFDAAGALSNGAGPRMFCGNTGSMTGGLTRRGLLAFGVAGAIPKRSTIVSATLTLNMVQGVNGQAVTLHRVLASWGEGSSIGGGARGGAGGPATPGDATWVHRAFNTQLWQSAGGDFDATASGSAMVAGIGPVTWASTAAMVADVQRWLDNPAQSDGWMLRTLEVGQGTAMAFDTKESLTPADRPQLVIVYTPPPAIVTSTGAGCNAGGATPFTLGAIGLPTVPNPAFALTLSGGPVGPGAILLCLALSPFPIPIGSGCFIYIDPTTVAITLPGVPNLPIPVPGTHSLIGTDLSFQAAVVNGATFALGTSNALTLGFGL